MGYVTVSAKIPRRLKELLDRYGIRPSSIGEFTSVLSTFSASL